MRLDDALRESGESEAARRNRRRHRRLWCRGREGVPHEVAWKDEPEWLCRFPNSSHVPQVLACRGCGKKIDYRYRCRTCHLIFTSARLTWDHKNRCPERGNNI